MLTSWYVLKIGSLLHYSQWSSNDRDFLVGVIIALLGQELDIEKVCRFISMM